MHLDNNGTTFLLPEIREHLRELLNEDIGNPASLSAEGRRANDIVETARDDLAGLLGCGAEQITFTSSGSEANVAVIRSALRTTGRTRVVISAIEHSSLSTLSEVLESEGVTVRTVRVSPSGVIDIEDLHDAVDETTAIVSVQMVNNETGVIQPYKTAGQVAHRFGALYHSDAAQAVGKMRCVMRETGADFLTLTAHKFHGPQGVGAIVATSPSTAFYPLIPGGSQEQGRRGGTHNVLSIAGLGAAARLRAQSLQRSIASMTSLRDTFERLLRQEIPELAVNGDPDRRVCNTSNLRFPGIDGTALYLRLLSAGIACSQSSACTAQIPEASKVLRAMGLTPEQAFSSIRFSFSVMNSNDEIRRAVETISAHYRILRSFAA